MMEFTAQLCNYINYDKSEQNFQRRGDRGATVFIL